MGERGPLKIAATELRLVREGEEPAAETAASRMKPIAPPKPKGLPKVASDAWDEIVPALTEAGLIGPTDGPGLALAVRHYAAAVKASNSLMRTPVTKRDDKNGRDMKNPASQVFRDHSTAFLEFAKQHGLTFVSRARVTLGDENGGNDGNPFE